MKDYAEIGNQLTEVFSDLSKIALTTHEDGSPAVWAGKDVFEYLLSDKADTITEDEYEALYKKMEKSVIHNAQYFYHYSDLVVVPDDNIFFCNEHGLRVLFTIIGCVSKTAIRCKMWLINQTPSYDEKDDVFLYEGVGNTFRNWIRINRIDPENEDFIWRLIKEEDVPFDIAIKRRLDGKTSPIVQLKEE